MAQLLRLDEATVLPTENRKGAPMREGEAMDWDLLSVTGALSRVHMSMAILGRIRQDQTTRRPSDAQAGKVRRARIPALMRKFEKESGS